MGLADNTETLWGGGNIGSVSKVGRVYGDRDGDGDGDRDRDRVGCWMLDVGCWM